MNHTPEAIRRVYWSVARWHTAGQNHFEARMEWQQAGAHEEANHNPVVILNGNALKYRWWQYYEADGCNGKGPDGGPAVSVANAASRNARFTAPLVGASTDIHIILEVKDNGSPKLTSYRRIVVTVKPEDRRRVRDGSIK
jgi:hypothetical protein